MKAVMIKLIPVLLAGLHIFYIGLCFWLTFPSAFKFIHGPYSIAAIDSLGGLRGGFVLLPIFSLLISFVGMFRSSLMGLMGSAGLLLCTVMIQGYLIHMLPYWTGAEQTELLILQEVGIDSLPDNVKEAIKISIRLAQEGHAPWFPFQWKEHIWPV